VPHHDITAAIADGSIQVARQMVKRFLKQTPWLLNGEPQPAGWGEPPERERTDGAPTAEELTAAFGDPEAPPRNFTELAELMVRRGGGIVSITNLEELEPLKEALREALERDPDRP
jgi:hypothetical protein